MSNTEINSLFEITKSLEIRGLYTQADKAREIMVRLSQDGMYSSAPAKLSKSAEIIVSNIIEELESSGLMLAGFGLASFIPFVKKHLPIISVGFSIFALINVWQDCVEINKLSSKFNWKKFVSGEDTTGADIAEQILDLLINLCMVFSPIFPPFNYWVYILTGIKATFNTKVAKQLGYELGGMPGGEAQMKAIESFDLNKDITDPNVRKLMSSIILELGINSENKNKDLNASKLPRPIGGLDFFIPLIRKFDTQNKFKDFLSDKPSITTMELKSAIAKLIPYIKTLQAQYKFLNKSK